MLYPITKMKPKITTTSQPTVGLLPPTAGNRWRVLLLEMEQQEDQTQRQHQQQAPRSPPQELMASYVSAMESALLPCLPARELQAIDRNAHSSHQIDVERYARDFMEAAKKLEAYFISLQHDDQPTKTEILQKEINAMEEELKTKNELIKKHEALLEGWGKEVKEQLEKHIVELENA